ARSAIAPRVRLVKMPYGLKDPSALYLSNPAEFSAAFQKALDEAESFRPAVGEAVPPAQADNGSGLSKLIADFNQQYAVVNEAGKTLVFEQVFDPILKRKVLVRFTFDSFRKLYQNRLLTVPGNPPITKTVANWWLNDPGRRQYLSGVVFDPTEKSSEACWN